MKYIAIAVAIGIVILSIWIFTTTPPCEGNYKFSLGGDQHFFFECSDVPAVISSETPPPSIAETKTKNGHDTGATNENIDESSSGVRAAVSSETRPSLVGETNTKNVQETDHSDDNVGEPICNGSIKTVLTNNIAAAGRIIPIQKDLRLHANSMSAVESDVSIENVSGAEIAKFTLRVGDEVSFMFNDYKYSLLLNSISKPLARSRRINVTMHKVKCS